MTTAGSNCAYACAIQESDFAKSPYAVPGRDVEFTAVKADNSVSASKIRI
jgi:hypothetical protein